MSQGRHLTTSMQTHPWPLLSQLAALVSLHSLHSPLLLSPPVSVLLSLLQDGSHSIAFLLPLLVLLLFLPPLLGTSSSQPRLHLLSPLCSPSLPSSGPRPEGWGVRSCPHHGL